MAGETDIAKLLATMTPELNPGEYVFCTVDKAIDITQPGVICLFKEKEALTVVLEKGLADSLNLTYSYVASWITLTVHSSLEAVGLTAAFSAALAKKGISCNVIAAYYHDHIFVALQDAEKAMVVLSKMSDN